MIVQVYKNLHKSRAAGRSIYSVRDKKTGLVLGHVKEIVLKDVVFKVSETGRLRVLKEKKKNVHAVLQGEVYHGKFYDLGYSKPQKVWYNPYKTNQFISCKTGKKVYNCKYARICSDGVFIK